jgi:restriction endonuclease
MKNALKAGTLDLPRKYEAARERFETIILNADRMPPVRDASKDVVVRLNKQVMISPEFLELWNKIKQKTAYRVEIDTETLIENCVKALQDMPSIPQTRARVPDGRYSHGEIRHLAHRAVKCARPILKTPIRFCRRDNSHQ